ADLRIDRRRRAADGRLGVAGGATARVVARPEADAVLAGDGAGDGVDLLEASFGVVEEVEDRGGVICENRGEGIACRGAAAADSGVGLGNQWNDDTQRENGDGHTSSEHGSSSIKPDARLWPG